MLYIEHAVQLYIPISLYIFLCIFNMQSTLFYILIYFVYIQHAVLLWKPREEKVESNIGLNLLLMDFRPLLGWAKIHLVSQKSQKVL